MTVDLAAWLTAIWDEEQATAEHASPGPWRLNDEHSEVLAVDDIEVCTAFALSNNQLRWTARHIALQDPSAVLARIAADRKLLELHTGDNDEPCQSYAGNWTYEPCDTAKALASRYADRPGCRAEWLPLERQESGTTHDQVGTT